MQLLVTDSGERAMADAERNKQTVARLFDAFRAGDVDAFDDLIVENYVQHSPPLANGLQAVKPSSLIGSHKIDYRALRGRISSGAIGTGTCSASCAIGCGGAGPNVSDAASLAKLTSSVQQRNEGEPGAARPLKAKST